MSIKRISRNFVKSSMVLKPRSKKELKSFVAKEESGRGNLFVYERLQQLLKLKLVVFC